MNFWHRIHEFSKVRLPFWWYYPAGYQCHSYLELVLIHWYPLVGIRDQEVLWEGGGYEFAHFDAYLDKMFDRNQNSLTTRCKKYISNYQHNSGFMMIHFCSFCVYSFQVDICSIPFLVLVFVDVAFLVSGRQFLSSEAGWRFGGSSEVPSSKKGKDVVLQSHVKQGL